LTQTKWSIGIVVSVGEGLSRRESHSWWVAIRFQHDIELILVANVNFKGGFPREVDFMLAEHCSCIRGCNLSVLDLILCCIPCREGRDRRIDSDSQIVHATNSVCCRQCLSCVVSRCGITNQVVHKCLIWLGESGWGLALGRRDRDWLCPCKNSPAL
jgi:hypothetical protein